MTPECFVGLSNSTNFPSKHFGTKISSSGTFCTKVNDLRSLKSYWPKIKLLIQNEIKTFTNKSQRQLKASSEVDEW